MNQLLMVNKTNVIFSHFETVADDVLSIYKRIMGHDLDLTLPTENA